MRFRERTTPSNAVVLHGGKARIGSANNTTKTEDKYGNSQTPAPKYSALPRDAVAANIRHR